MKLTGATAPVRSRVAPVRFGDGETKRASSPGAKMPFIKPADWAVE